MRVAATLESAEPESGRDLLVYYVVRVLTDSMCDDHLRLEEVS